MKVVIVAEHASLKFGGEAALPVHYYRILRRRQIPVWLVVHERTRNELESLFPDDHERIVYVPDTKAHLFVWRLSKYLPDRISNFTVGFVLRYMTQVVQRREIRRLIAAVGISIVHQPIPVSPKEPSLICGLGVPVIIGPMNGGMNYPSGFLRFESRAERVAVAAGRWFAHWMNWLMPGKRQAAVLLVANERTRASLPRGVSSDVISLVENGVDLSLWIHPDSEEKSFPQLSSTTRFVFMGRLVALKCVDLLLLAFKSASGQAPMSLTIIGNGEEHTRLEIAARELGLLSERKDEPGKVCFLGWKSQAECVKELACSDALVLPSVKECGGAVVLEAMAMEVPVIATAWGGPLDYLDSSCGILVPPSSPQSFTNGLEDALVRFAMNPSERRAMGKSGRIKVVKEFDWETKIDQVLTIYRHCINLREKSVC